MLMTMMLVENHFKPLRPVMDPHDLEELLRRIALGSQQAFEELYLSLIHISEPTRH